MDEKPPSWLAGIREGFKYFASVTQLLVVDNTRCAVNDADWIDPDISIKSFSISAAIIKPLLLEPALEVLRTEILLKFILELSGAGSAESWAKTFFSLGDLNRFLLKSADEFNDRYQRKYGSSRRERSEQYEKITLKPLPLKTYESGEWKKAKPHEDCHIQHKYNDYSAPYQHRGKDLDVRATLSHVEIFFQQERIAIHQQRPDSQRGNYCTDKSHLPEKFQAMDEITVSRQIREAKKIGPNTEKIITTLLTEVSHPLTGW